MELIYEKYDVRVCADCLYDVLHPLLKISAVLGSGHYRGNVKGYDAFPGQDRGYRTVRNLEGYTLHDCRLADSRLTYEHWIVLLPPSENLDYPGYLIVPADDRIQLPLGSSLGQVCSELGYVCSLFLMCLL